MDLRKLGAICGDCVRVVIEIPLGTIGAKYEFDDESGFFILDRMRKAPMCYPCAYGFIPNTKGGDGDALDALVLCSVTLPMGVVASARPMGMLITEDESGRDEKILVAVDGDPMFGAITSYEDIPVIAKQLEHFFQRYKDLDSNKWVKVAGWEGASSAWEVINASIV